MRLDEEKIKKDRLRAIAREYSDNAVIEVAHHLSAKESVGMSEDTKKEIKKLYCELFKEQGYTESKNIPIQDLFATLQPEKCVESKNKYRRKAADGTIIRPQGPK